MAIDMPDIEAAAAADTVAGEIARARAHALAVGTPCPNCGTRLAGPWCYNCGQKGEKYDRSIWRLMGEALEGLTHLDGRFWTTGPRLIFRPGKLTHDYLNGHRAAQLPPFRIFLIVLLMVFFAGGLAVDQSHPNFALADATHSELTQNMTPKEKAEFDREMAPLRNELAAGPLTAAAQEAAARTAASNAKAGRTANLDMGVSADTKVTSRSAWVRQRVTKALKNPDSFFVAIEQWGHRFAILLLPIAALMLTGLFAFRKSVYVFDHVIFAMHSLSFVGILLTTIFLVSIVAPGVWWLLLAAPVHLFFHMRGTYRTGVFGTLARMSLLFVGTTIAVSLLGVGLVFVGLATAH
ncbi:DUF3667 domain-containing protein [Phenylobacterium sp.]|uniref:DUF3667 domain-containing protein n=1 Tax=Phenylobacterium sp. TaxID=1871053 RepID=UPI00286CE2E4|nr:DUF3667 domain-containing protein [Phenylobacterium sp.]